MQTFFVFKSGGEYHPMAFVSPADEAGKFRKESYEKKLRDGESIVTVVFNEI